jgi:hypothetical protein
LEPLYTSTDFGRVEMSAPEVDGRANAGPESGHRRIRHLARDGVSVAGLSIGASVGVTLALWALLRWLG